MFFILIKKLFIKKRRQNEVTYEVTPHTKKNNIVLCYSTVTKMYLSKKKFYFLSIRSIFYEHIQCIKNKKNFGKKKCFTKKKAAIVCN